MSIDTIFYTQVGSIVAFLVALFAIYRLLVEQKDSVIQLLKERLSEKEEKIKELQAQSPDALASSLSARVEISLKELGRLKLDSETRKEEINTKESELRSLRQRLTGLSILIQDSDFVCKKCGSPLNQRTFFPIYGHVNGREVEAEGEYVEYECGLAIREGKEVSACREVSSNPSLQRTPFGSR